MGTSVANVAGGSLTPEQVANAIGKSQQNIREQTNWALDQALRRSYSRNLNPDGSLNQTGLLTEAGKLGLGPSAVKAWLETQNATNEAAVKQTQGNATLKMYGLDPSALRDQGKLGNAPVATPAPKPMTDPKQSGVTGSAVVAGEAPKDERSFKDKLAEMFGFKPATKEQQGAPVAPTAQVAPTAIQAPVQGAPVAPTAPTAQPAIQAPVQGEKSILERLADSGTGLPSIPKTVYKQFTPADIASMPELQRDEFIAGLRNAGITFTGAAPTNEQIAAGMNKVQDAAVAGLFSKINPLDPTKIGEMMSAGQAAGSTAQAAIEALAKSGRETASTHIGNKGSIQQQNQSATEFAQVQAQVKQFKKLGYNATPGNVDKVAEADANYEQVKAMRTKTQEEMNPEHLNKLSNDDFNVEIADRLRNLASLEGVTTESADERFMGLIRKNPSWGELAYSAKSPKEFLVNIVRKGLGSKEKIEILKTIDQMLGASISDAGRVGKERNKYRAKTGAAAFLPNAKEEKKPEEKKPTGSAKGRAL